MNGTMYLAMPTRADSTAVAIAGAPAMAAAAKEANATGDEKTGLTILRRALSAPTRQIAENSAVDQKVIAGLDRLEE